MKANLLPSGEYNGRDSSAGSLTSRCASPPPAGTVQMSLPLTKAISLPSGEIAGWDNEGRGTTLPCARARGSQGSETKGNIRARARKPTRTGNLNREMDGCMDELTPTEDASDRALHPWIAVQAQTLQPARARPNTRYVVVPIARKPKEDADQHPKFYVRVTVRPSRCQGDSMPIYDRTSIPESVASSTKDPEIAEWLKTGPVLGSHKPIHVQRREHDAFIDKDPPPIDRIEYLGLAGPHGTIPVRVYHPSKTGAGPTGALIYLHGGGFVVGSLDQFDTAMRRLAEGSGAQVYAVDYKLAPEYQWPVQIEEGECVVRWLFANAAERQVDARRIALGGDSAGGNMTCVIAQKLHDEDGPRLALQMPLYPEAKMPFDTPAAVENVSGGYVDTAGVLLFVWSLLPQGVDYTQPYITPLNAKDFSDLPPTLLVTCGFDMLRDVGHAYARKLAGAGNDIVYVHYPDLPHGIIQMTMHSERCLFATNEIARLLGDRLAGAAAEKAQT